MSLFFIVLRKPFVLPCFLDRGYVMSLSVQQERIIHYALCIGVPALFFYLSREVWHAVYLFVIYVFLTVIHEDLTDTHQMMNCSRRSIVSYVPNHLASFLFGVIVFFIEDSLAYGLAAWMFFVIITCMMSLLRDIQNIQKQSKHNMMKPY